jgi:hypothetical protein
MSPLHFPPLHFLRELNKPDATGVKLRAKAELWKKLGY